MDRVKGKVAIVTGAASGIGESTAKLLAREGAQVAVVDIDDDNGRRVVREIVSAGGEAVYHHMNVAIEKEVEQIISDIYKKYGKLNILVNNAGIAGGGGPSHLLSNEEWDRVMNINLKGPFWCVKYAVPYFMKSGSGSVINVSSIMGILGGPTPAYCSSKGGIRTLTKADAVTYAKQNIRFNSVHPGYIITPLFKTLAAKSPGGVEKQIEKESQGIPLGRMGLPEDIANGILYLASDESSYVTGIELIIDGGKIII
ncbi:MAG: short-chain dehydrogenase [Chloroflexi bacterium RBG_16_56_11]|nr:MAG: short-chain dehydrogenase [Chloroflexi bacterium RBG_16_56_11]